MDQGVCGTCPICLGDIRPEDEAFLDTCFHSACYKASGATGTQSEPAGLCRLQPALPSTCSPACAPRLPALAA